MFACEQQATRLALEAHSPFKGLRHVASPSVRVQVVNEVATSDNQHSFVAQWRQLAPDLKMKAGGLGLVDAELHDRYVGSRIDVFEHRPRAVIEPPSVVERNRQRREHLLDA